MSDSRGWPPGQVPPPGQTPPSGQVPPQGQVPPPGYGQPPPGQYYPPPYGHQGYAPPGFNPFAPAQVQTSPVVVLLVGALAGLLVSFLVVLPLSTLVNYVSFKVPFDRVFTGQLAPFGRSGVPTIVLTTAISLLQGLAMGLVRLGIRSTGGWIAAGTLVGLVLRLAFALVVFPLIGGFPIAQAARSPMSLAFLVGYGIVWALLVAVILAVTTRR